MSTLLRDPGLVNLAERGYVTDDWSRWQQVKCGGYAAALLRMYPHLRLGGVDWCNDRDDDTGELYDNPGHFVAHDDRFAYDSAGIHPLPYGGVDGDGRWLPDIGDPHEHGLCECYGECGDYDDYERMAVISHATRHGILPNIT